MAKFSDNAKSKKAAPKSSKGQKHLKDSDGGEINKPLSIPLIDQLRDDLDAADKKCANAKNARDKVRNDLVQALADNRAEIEEFCAKGLYVTPSGRMLGLEAGDLKLVDRKAPKPEPETE